jgi:hypothetical protein
VVPNHTLFIGLLVVFEALAGILVLFPGRPRQLALLALIGFNAAVVSFSWFFVFWSTPVVVALGLLLRAERRREATTSDRRGDEAPGGYGSGGDQPCPPRRLGTRYGPLSCRALLAAPGGTKGPALPSSSSLNPPTPRGGGSFARTRRAQGPSDSAWA